MGDFQREVKTFQEFGKETQCQTLEVDGLELPVYVNEFWTAKQRAAHSLHEISYRACFKPQLPRFFIERLTDPGDRVLDPFSGRGTTGLEAALLGRIPVAGDANPLAEILLRARLNPPRMESVKDRLAALPLEDPGSDFNEELLVFYHSKTLLALENLRKHLAPPGSGNAVDDWIRLVATNRLTGHSPGFFSVYTLPPNQATSVVAQRRINAKRGQSPPERDVRTIILKKSRNLLSDLTDCDFVRLAVAASNAVLRTGFAHDAPDLKSGTVQLVVTSPPFLDVVDYRGDNWLRCWFNQIDAGTLPVWNVRKESAWQERMTQVFRELRRVLVRDGSVAFEVGEIRGGSVLLERTVIRAACEAGLIPEFVLINAQVFTKTANCWGVDNNQLGTNSNRVVLLRKAN